MIVRSLIGFTLLSALLLLPGLVGCQPWTNGSVTKENLEELTQNVKNLSDKMVTRHDLDEAAKGWAAKQDVIDLGARVATVEKGVLVNLGAINEQKDISRQLAKRVNQEIPDQLASLKADLVAANERLARMETSAAQVASLRQKLDRVEKDVEATHEVTGEHGVIIGQLAKKDNRGNWIPAIYEPTKESTQFKEEFGKAVNEVISPRPQTCATLRIDNQTADSQYLEVNGVGYWVGPRSIRDFDVPAGWATTRLVPFEAAKSWWISSPNYFRTVIVSPTPVYNSVVWYP